MAKFAWCTDIHLDTVKDEGTFDKFAASVISSNPSGIFLTGDISTAKDIVFHLSVLERLFSRPIYYVLGNHDFWGGKTADVRNTMRELGNVSQYLRYLPNTQYLSLDNKTALVGADGWYDALNGNYAQSSMVLNDWFRIGDFAEVHGGKKLVSRNEIDRKGIAEIAKKLAHESVTHVHNSIKAAARYHKRIILLTHVPPFEESHTYNGAKGDVDAAPWYTSKMMGDMLRQAATAYPNVNFDVYCGHTHGKYEGMIEKNLRVNVGHADYGTPQLQSLVEV